MMMYSALLTLSAAAGALAACTSRSSSSSSSSSSATCITANTESTNNGYFYSVWSNGEANICYENGDDGEYSVTWSGDSGNFVVGKGWSTGSSTKSIAYTADFEPSGNAYLSVYGWMEDPLIEYYILESYGTYNPSSGLTKLGSVTCNSGTYYLYKTTRTDAASIEGTTTFSQYWSIRQSKRTSGTVTVSCHFAGWEDVGLSIGSTMNYQILATEGYESSGSSTVTVS